MFALFWSACSGSIGLTDPTPPDVTWHRDVRPVTDQYCVQCHSDGNIAPFAFDDPSVVQAMAGAMVASVESRAMPPWGMDPDCRPSTGSLWLPDDLYATFLDWRANGFELGDEAEYVPAPLPPPVDMGEPDLVLTPAEPYAPDTSTPDDYRCLPVAETLDRELYVTGVRTLPQNLAVAHHVILFAIAPSAIPELEALDAADPKPGYECFGDSGLDDAQTVGGWAPGNTGRRLPEGVAQRIPAGSRLVMQMHYNTESVVGDPGTDQTSAELWTLPEGEVPAEVMVVYPIVKLGLMIPAGEEHSVQTARSRLPIEGRILGNTPHMHTRGTSMSTTIHRPDGAEQCLTQVDRWQFGWQMQYGLPETEWIPISIEDEVEITCTYDNGDNDAMVTWGEGTSDEMCLDYVGVVVPWLGEGTGGTCSGYPTCSASCAPDDPFCNLQCMTASNDSCLFCGLEGLFGECVGFSCAAPGLALLGCMESCAPEFEGVVGCLYDECRAAFDDYWACAQPVLESGTCSESFAGCSELSGVP